MFSHDIESVEFLSHSMTLEELLTRLEPYHSESRYFKIKLGFLAINNPLEYVEFLSHPT